ncbi:MAG: DNA gyrase/topoisomerase IV subunit A [Flavobacteriales bacterium]|nr:DNA gyrase/topoisomerase IV subunit A [Flavobacteriales bacterium]
MSDEQELDSNQNQELGGGENLDKVIQVQGLYQEWFLDYASYVILERAVPHLHDGLKPVQRRILHSLWEMDDGRFNKVANVIGNTMKYHPHGDASIGDAMVQIGQKELLIDTQGNWGNIHTGDSAAAARYIEARLSKFALDVAFNPKTTSWLASYDGRNKEPDTLPMKFPLLLTQGVEGIAVGLACKILPHNFNELIDASIDVLKEKRIHLLPDFLTGGLMDAADYNSGLRGGRVRVRARIKKEDNKTLQISEIPFGTTTSSLIDSILKANDKGKIKIRKIEDNTAGVVEIIVHLATGVSPDKTIDALYAFTDCGVSISPNVCVIEDDKPAFIGVEELLRRSTYRTRDLIKWELDIKKGELQESWHFASLEKIFIEKRIYRNIEESETWEEIISTIHAGLKPHVKKFNRPITDEDVAKLTEIKIKRISRFDAKKADDYIIHLEEEIALVEDKLNHLIETTIAYFKELKHKYGKGRERRTEIKTFDTVQAAQVAIANAKLYANKAEGFVGIGLKRDEGEFVSDCSDIDDIIVFRRDGVMMVKKVEAKSFFGKDIIHVAVWKKDDKRTIYNLIYRDGKSGPALLKRFGVTAITRDKEYALTKGAAGSEIIHFSANPNGEAEVVTINLKPLPKLKKLKFDIDFSEQLIKGRDAIGNVVTKYPVRKIELKSAGISTLGARSIWIDETVQRLNDEGRGRLLGEFEPDDKLLILQTSGEFSLISPDLSTHFPENMSLVEKWIPEKPISCVYYDGEKENWFVKRFVIEGGARNGKFVTEHAQSKASVVTTFFTPKVIVRLNKKFKQAQGKDDFEIELKDFISLKGMKALGNRVSTLPVLDVQLLPIDELIEAEESEKFWTTVRSARLANAIEKMPEIHQNPDDIEFEIDGLNDEINRFKKEVQKPKEPGTQGELF